MTYEFVLKRIKEQRDYLNALVCPPLDAPLRERQRHQQVYDSAKAQLFYFVEKAKEMESNISTNYKNCTYGNYNTDFLQSFARR